MRPCQVETAQDTSEAHQTTGPVRTARCTAADCNRTPATVCSVSRAVGAPDACCRVQRTWSGGSAADRTGTAVGPGPSDGTGSSDPAGASGAVSASRSVYQTSPWNQATSMPVRRMTTVVSTLELLARASSARDLSGRTV